MATRAVRPPGLAAARRGDGGAPPSSAPGAGGGERGRGEREARPVSPTKKPAKPPPSKKKKGGEAASGGNPRMAVPKAVVDELLLVCGVIGSEQVPSSSSSSSSSSTDDRAAAGGADGGGGGEPKFVPVADCLNWLQDLQRALRRDDDSYRPVSLLLGRWRVVSQKLLPLVLSCRYDTPLVLTVVKILVILTKPMSDAARRAGRLVVDVTSGKTPDSVVREQIRLRENAVAQSRQLLEYKRLFVRHPSHLGASPKGERGSSGGGTGGGGGLLSVFVSLLAEPLSKTGTDRTDADHLTVELVLHLFRNLLSAEAVLLGGSAEKAHEHAALHHDLISLFERELVLDVLLVLGQDMESRENAPYNLLLMEILSHLLRGQDPALVARAAAGGAASAPSSSSFARRSAEVSATAAGGSGSGSGSRSGGSLRAVLRKERRMLASGATSRHSHFGGTLVATDGDGRRRYVSAGALTGGGSGAEGAGGVAGGASSMGGGAGTMAASAAGAGARPRRKNRKLDAFVGSGRTSALHTREGLSVGSRRGASGPSALRARSALHSFCVRFADECYGPVMKSIKNEFRRDSVRLEEGDRSVFFRIVWFFCQWWRVWKLEGGGSEGRAADDNGADGDGISGASAIGKLIFTMDVFTFNLILNSTETYHQRKKHGELARAVALYSEMTHLLRAMHSSQDPTERVMALGLMDRLFYGPEPTDRLPRLLSRWTPGFHAREYVCDLAELTHATLELLDANAASCAAASAGPEASGRGGRRGKKGKGKTAEEKKRQDAVARMNATAADFDVTSYFVKKIVSNHVVFMYTRLLGQYAVNSSRINEHAVAFLVRLCRLTIAEPEDEGDVGALSNPIALKTTTLEPMLFNIQTLSVLNDVLNDGAIRDDPHYDSLLSFATVIMRHFSKAAEANPMLFVECLFRHPVPHRFCELVANSYVTEELRMMAERELLLEEQRRMAEEEEEEPGSDAEPAADEEELEFVDADEDEARPRGAQSRDAEPASGKEQEDEEEAEFMDKDAGASDRKEEGPLENTKNDEEGSISSVHKRKRPAEGNSAPDADAEKANEGAKAESALGDASEASSEAAPDKDTPKQHKRIKRKVVLEDSDDEEEMFGETETRNAGTQSSQLVLDDDEDDD